jgi:hypothetical protein
MLNIIRITKFILLELLAHRITTVGLPVFPILQFISNLDSLPQTAHI